MELQGIIENNLNIFKILRKNIKKLQGQFG